MLSTGIVRRLDELGRIVMPIELRRRFGISDGDRVEIYVDGDMVVIQTQEKACVLCGSYADDVIYVKGKRVCSDCARQLTAT